MQRTILVVARHRTLRDSITSALRRDNYVVLAIADGTEVVEVAQTNPFSLILLDPVDLEPGVLDICRQLRACPETDPVPILMLVMDEIDMTQVMALDLGIDDYIMKPLNTEELRACVRALVRGRRRSPVKTWKRPVMEKAMKEEQILLVDDLSIDVVRRKVIRHDHIVELASPLLFDLLVYLVCHRGIVFTRAQLLMQVWGYESTDISDTRTVDV